MFDVRPSWSFAFFTCLRPLCIFISSYMKHVYEVLTFVYIKIRDWIGFLSREGKIPSNILRLSNPRNEVKKLIMHIMPTNSLIKINFIIEFIINPYTKMKPVRKLLNVIVSKLFSYENLIRPWLIYFLKPYIDEIFKNTYKDLHI